MTFTVSLDLAAEGVTDRATRWEPISTAPKDTHVLCWLDDGYMQVGIFATDYKSWVFTGLDDGGMNPTHWMPLPAAPTPETT